MRLQLNLDDRCRHEWRAEADAALGQCQLFVGHMDGSSGPELKLGLGHHDNYSLRSIAFHFCYILFSQGCECCSSA